MDQKTLDAVKEMVAAGATPADVERFCGKSGVEFHPLACDVAFGVPCNHLTPAQSKSARDEFAARDEFSASFTAPVKAAEVADVAEVADEVTDTTDDAANDVAGESK